MGLSPHGRGKRAAAAMPTPKERSIPARAGETAAGREHIADFRVYPRTGGGNRSLGNNTQAATGLSPHGRGKLDVFSNLEDGVGSIPARAGETTKLTGSVASAGVYPRTGGGNNPPSPTPSSDIGLSPHGRGKRYKIGEGQHGHRSIPARAGETLRPTLPAHSP